MKYLKRFLLVVTLSLTTFSLFGCKSDSNVIKIGNTASKTGAAAHVGLPFGYAIEAVVKYYNDGKFDFGLIQDMKIEYIWYDDKTTADEGKAKTLTLINDDKILALVGHFASWTIEPTIDYIREKQVPVVHAATGSNILMTPSGGKEPGAPVMPVQPIYYTEAQALLARVMTMEIFGGKKLAADGTKKIVIAHSNREDADDVVQGLDELIAEENLNTKYQFVKREFKVDNAQSVANQIKADNPAAIIIASDQQFYEALTNELNRLSVTAPIFTSYVNADLEHIKAANVANLGDLYFNGWNDMSNSAKNKAELAKWREIVDYAWPNNRERADLVYGSTHSKSGYAAIMTFIHGLRKLNERGIKIKEQTLAQLRKELITSLEKEVVDLPLAGTVDFRNGLRLGTQDFMLWKYDRANHKLIVDKNLENAQTIIESAR